MQDFLSTPCPPPFPTPMPTNIPSHLHQKPSTAVHRRHPSDELDVFEAARYLSGTTDATVIGFGGTTWREDGQQMYNGGSEQHWSMVKPSPVQQPDRNPLRQLPPIAADEENETKTTKKKKQHNLKQPVSPGSRLATFLTHLFHQKKPKSASSKTTAISQEDDDGRSGAGRRRRSSIDVARASDTKSLYSCRSMGFRSPPHKVDADGGGNNGKIGSSRSVASYPAHAAAGASEPGFGIWGRGWASMESKVHVRELLGKDVVCCGAEKKWTLVSKSDRTLIVKGGFIGDVDRLHPKGRDQLWRTEEVEEDNGGESDSSSDLFELPNYDHRVYETTID